MVNPAWGVMVLLGLGLGCSKSAKDIAESHRKTAEPVLAQLAALAPIAKAAPPISTDGFQLPAGVKLDFKSFENPGYNAAVVYLVDLADPCAGEILWDDNPSTPISGAPLDRTDTWLAGPACLLQTGKGRHGGEAVVSETTRGFTQLEATKYVLVIYLRIARAPGFRPLTDAELDALVAGNRPARLDEKVFIGGKFAGDARLYELATARAMGGFSFSFDSRDKVRKKDDGKTDELEHSLTGDAESGLASTLLTMAPGSHPLE